MAMPDNNNNLQTVGNAPVLRCHPNFFDNIHVSPFNNTPRTPRTNQTSNSQTSFLGVEYENSPFPTCQQQWNYSQNVFTRFSHDISK